ncbi:MarR family winged helix-turn-helix transcriptional regulator [Cystobacter fuscus]|uniref:MarR family winged helix-turn-helix transcriptional regulator n=1 Tax=Cystobacter fuscus TaxID=43 RepID=UPI0037BF8922
MSSRTRRSLHQLVALKVIALRGVHTQAQLAERLLIDAPAVSRLVDRLQEDGLVTREAGADRRCVRLQVTNACWPEVEVLEDEVRRVDEEVAKHLTAEEMSELKRLLDKVHVALGANTAVNEKQLAE